MIDDTFTVPSEHLAYVLIVLVSATLVAVIALAAIVRGLTHEWMRQRFSDQRTRDDAEQRS